MNNYDFITEKTLEYIVKHELGHGLGLIDLTNPKYENKSIMYHEINSNIFLHDYSELDKLIIKQLYDGQAIYVEYPTHIQVYYKKPEEHELL